MLKHYVLLKRCSNRKNHSHTPFADLSNNLNAAHMKATHSAWDGEQLLYTQQDLILKE
jgi:hypothetical protein